MNFLKPKNSERVIVENLLKTRNASGLFKDLTYLQNEIAVYFNTEIVAIVGVDNDILSAAFAKAFADTYSLNCSKALLIDANLYNSSSSFVAETEPSSDVMTTGNINPASDNEPHFFYTDKAADIVAFQKSAYPDTLYKNDVIQRLISDNADKYEHFVVALPSVKTHKDVRLFSGFLSSIVLVVQKNITTKKDVFDAIGFFKRERLPLAKTVLLK